MGLFGKKESELCPVCGGEITGLFKTKIAGKQQICKECTNEISMQKNLLKNADVQFIKEHLAYRAEQEKLYSSLHFTHSFDFLRSVKVEADEENKLVAIGDVDTNSFNQPAIFSYDQLLSYELWLENKKLDDDKTPGETFSMSVTAALGKFVNSSDMQFFTIKLKTTDKYWPEMNILAQVPNNLKYSGYQDNMKGIGHLLKCIVRKEPFVME